LKTALIFLFSLGVVFSLKAQPVITQQPTNQTVLVGSSVVFSVAVSGSGPFTYQWQFNGTNLPTGIITTVAGNGIQGYSGDNGAATSEELSNPFGAAIDNNGNLFIADQGNNRIRKVATNGIITTVAGNGVRGYSGDNGAATNAELNQPTGVAIDNNGNLFIADEYNYRIRKVATNGIITTVAGNGIQGYSGDNGAATNAELSNPSGVATDNNGNLFIADQGNSRIRKVATNGILTTVAGNGTRGFSGDNGATTSAELSYPTGVAIDNNGNLFIADEGNNRIRMVATNGIITTVAGNGVYGYSSDNAAATSAELRYPTGVAIDNNGNLFIADYMNQRIRKVATNGIITTVAGNGTNGYSGDNGAATSAELNHPTGVAIDNNGNLFIADYFNQRIRKVATNGIITTVAGNGTNGYYGDKGVATSEELNEPAGVAIGNNGELFIADNGNNRIRKVATNGILTTVAGNGTGGYSGDNGAATNASLSLVSLVHPFGASGVATDSNGNLFIADWLNHRIRKVATDGIITTVAGGGTYNSDNLAATNVSLGYPSGVAIDNKGNLFFADVTRIRKVATNGIITTVAGMPPGHNYSGDNGPALQALFNNPLGVAVDNNGNLFIADNLNERIREVATNGIITTVAGNPGAAQNGEFPVGFSGDNGAATNAELSDPSGVATDNNGNLFIADWLNSRIRKVDTNGIITTVAGGGNNGLGDGGAATNAELNGPFGVAIDDNGNLFIADQGNNRIRKVDNNFSSQPAYILSSVSIANGGNYSVVVTSAAGSVTTSNAVLTVVFPAGYNQISSRIMSLGSMQISYVGIAGWKYALDRSFSLSPANWIPQATNLADANGNLVFTNTPDSTTNNFWRIRSVP
jgi:sugar lactone lactonase YvrE